MGLIMDTTVKYIVLKSKDYQLGTPLFQEELKEDSTYFDRIPEVIKYQSHSFKVLSKELTRLHNIDENTESQTILVKVIAMVS